MLYYLQKAIMDKYHSDGATLSDMTSGFWEDEAPSNTTLQTQTGEELRNPPKPFIVFSVILTDLEQDFCNNFYEPLVQFSIFGDANNKSSIELLRIGDEFLNVFGDQLLSMDGGYTMIRNDTVGQRKIKTPEKFWQVIYELDFIIEKAR